MYIVGYHLFILLCAVNLVDTSRFPVPRSKKSHIVNVNRHLFNFPSIAVFLAGQKAAARNGNHALEYSVKLPLYKYDGVFCTEYDIGGVRMQAIVDTGSPFLVVPSICSTEWGCLTKNEQEMFVDADLEDTTEIFGGQNYASKWKVGKSIKLGNIALNGIIFSLVGEDAFRPPGGVFMGLIKYKSDDIRPTFLSQTNFSCIRLNIPERTLELTSRHLINEAQNAVNLLDLRRDGDPVRHYTALIKELYINGMRIGKNKQLYAVFDTGTSGCVLQDDLFNDEGTPNPPREIKVVLESNEGNDVVLSASARSRKNIFVVTASDINWFKYERGECTRRSNNLTCKKVANKNDTPWVVVLGCAFLEDKIVTIDADQNKLLLAT